MSYPDAVEPCAAKADSPCEQKESADVAVGRPIGLQTFQLTVEEAEQIRKILDDPEHPAHAGKPAETVEPAALFRKKT